MRPWDNVPIRRADVDPVNDEIGTIRDTEDDAVTTVRTGTMNADSLLVGPVNPNPPYLPSQLM